MIIPECDAHTALDDVQTLADLFARVLRPIAEHRGLNTWEQLVQYAAEEWYPSRITFGKHKGRLFRAARQDVEMRHWIDWLANSSNVLSAKMGRWYLRQLEIEAEPRADRDVFTAPESEREGSGVTPSEIGPAALVVYLNPELQQLRQLVAGARARLAELQVDYTKEKSRVDATQAILFRHLREHYQKRDRLRLIVDYRKKYLDSLVPAARKKRNRPRRITKKPKRKLTKITRKRQLRSPSRSS